MIYDVRKRCFVTERPSGGMIGQISFSRIAEVLKAAGEIKSDEELTYIEVDDHLEYGLIKLKLPD